VNFKFVGIVLGHFFQLLATQDVVLGFCVLFCDIESRCVESEQILSNKSINQIKNHEYWKSVPEHGKGGCETKKSKIKIARTPQNNREMTALFPSIHLVLFLLIIFSKQLITQNRANTHVTLTLIGIQQMDLDAVVVAEHVIRNLQHRSDSRSTGNHNKLTALFCRLGFADRFDPVISAVPKVFHVSLRALDVNGVANFQGIQVLTQFSSVREVGMNIGSVDLDDENDFSECRVVAHGGVRTHDLYLFTGFLVGFEISKRNVLTGRQTEDRFRSWQSKDKFGRIMRQNRFANERKRFKVVHWQDGLLSVQRQENEAQHKGCDGHNAGKEYIVICKHGC
jgi:hypothetical protein